MPVDHRQPGFLHDFDGDRVARYVLLREANERRVVSVQQIRERIRVARRESLHQDVVVGEVEAVHRPDRMRVVHTEHSRQERDFVTASPERKIDEELVTDPDLDALHDDQ